MTTGPDGGILFTAGQNCRHYAMDASERKCDVSFVGRYNVCKSCLHDWLDNEFAETVSGGPEIGATLNIVANGFGCDLGYCDYTPSEVMDNG